MLGYTEQAFRWLQSAAFGILSEDTIYLMNDNNTTKDVYNVSALSTVAPTVALDGSSHGESSSFVLFSRTITPLAVARDMMLIILAGISFYFCIMHNTANRARAREESNNENNNNQNAALIVGPIARKAGLWRLTHDERRRIIRHIFQPKVYHKNDYEDVSRQIKEDDGSTKSNCCDIETGTTKCDNDRGDYHGLCVDQSDNGDDDDWCQTTTCPICFSKYEDGVSTVVTNMQCKHIFHYDCAMQWYLGGSDGNGNEDESNKKQNNDHCPYCRVEIMTPSTMRKAAFELLGRERFQEVCPFPINIKRNNENEINPDSIEEPNHSTLMEIFSPSSPSTLPSSTVELSSVSSARTQDHLTAENNNV